MPTVDGLAVRPDGCYADMTFGGGGHSREILRRLGAKGHLYAFDQDADAERNIPEAETRMTFVRSNFRYLQHWMRYYGVDALDGIIADLGVSSHHFDDEHRGFSFRFEAPLDMRMNGRGGQTAADLVNTAAEADLAHLFALYGELKNARRIAHCIVVSRAAKPYATVADLLQTLQPLMPREREKKDLAKAFQALRIAVNHEMEALTDMLDAAISTLRVGGRLAVLTYHSIEDRIVKNYIRAGNAAGEVAQDFYGNRLAPLKAVNNKVIVPTESEQTENPRSRSAKLRIAVKL
ncbi:MAG: 16S rRNA (cytosine(1402)-N(4))-methyltransferase RsmH [Bacteroidales bacterium]|nr:16S rRNA (cytosine(1402)-N(4))-methyltransferase RsmH [Candidatus Equimonas enterica]